MFLRAEKIANFNSSKLQNHKQIAFTMQLNMNLMSNVHVLDISDSVCTAEMFFMQYIFMCMLFLPINTLIISRFWHHLWMRKNILTSRKNLKRKNTPMVLTTNQLTTNKREKQKEKNAIQF